MKYSKKLIKKLYSNPSLNFSEIVSLAIFLEDNEEWDFTSEPISVIEKLPSDIYCISLIKDIKNRDESNFSNYAYQRIWWSLINTKDKNVYSLIKKHMNQFIINMFNYWLINELNPEIETYKNISELLSN